MRLPCIVGTHPPATAGLAGLLFVVEVTHNVREQMGAFSMFEKATAALNLYT